MTRIGVIVALVVVCTGVGLLVLSRGKKKSRMFVGPYEEVKKKIREEDHNREPEPYVPYDAAKPLNEVFAIKDPNIFFIELQNLCAHKAAKVGYGGLNKSELAIICIYDLEAEVNNGGFDQFFFNSAGDLANETAPALELVGAMKTADILRRALSAFENGSPSPNRQTRWRQMDQIPERQKEELWGKLDSEFYDYPDPITDLVFEYCQSHNEEFGQVGTDK